MARTARLKAKKPFHILCFCIQGHGQSPDLAMKIVRDLSGKDFDPFQHKTRDFLTHEGIPFRISSGGLNPREVPLEYKRGHRLTKHDLEVADLVITSSSDKKIPQYGERPELHEVMDRLKRDRRVLDAFEFAKLSEAETQRRLLERMRK